MLFQSSPVLDLAAWVATASLKGAALIAAVMLCRRLLAPATTSLWRHALWLPVLACLLSPLGPSVSLTGPIASTLPAPLAAPLTTCFMAPLSATGKVNGLDCQKVLAPAR